MPQDPSVGVLSRRLPGVNSLSEPSFEHQHITSLDTALASAWDFDAHFTTYVVFDEHGNREEAWPRLNKTVLPEIREAGCTVQHECIVLDFDNQSFTGKKQLWTPELRDQFETRFLAAYDKSFYGATSWHALHFTKHGVHVIYRLEKPIPTQLYRPLCLGVIDDWRTYGLDFDKAPTNWNTIYRLPYVSRDGDPPLDRDYVQLEFNPALLKRSQVKRHLEGATEQDTFTSTAAPLDAAIPEISPILSENFEKEELKTIKTRLRGRECYAPLFNLETPLAAQGARDTTLTQYVGQVCSLLAPLHWAEPRHVYALFEQGVLGWDQDDDWRGKLWTLICKFWPIEREKAEQWLASIKCEDETALSSLERIRHGIQQWDDPPLEVLTGDDQTARDWIQRNSILRIDNRFHFLQLDGSYSRWSETEMRMVDSRIQDIGMDAVLPLEELVDPEKGIVKKLSEKELWLRYGIHVNHQVIGHVTPRPNQLISPASPEKRKFSYCLFSRRDDIEPAYNPKVDQWLQNLGGRDYRLLLRWISGALAIEEGPICALYLQGPPSAGKQLLARGLAECFTHETAADSRVFGRFNHELSNTPVVVVDEGMRTYKEGSGTQDASEVFRSMIAGDPISIEQKNQTPFTIRVPVRMLFTANNLKPLTALFKDAAMQIDDRRAISKRVLLIQADERASVYLQVNGGLDFTARSPYRWVEGHAGERSDYIVAKHFLYLHQQGLYKQKEPTEDNRLLMSGQMNRLDEVFDSGPMQTEIMRCLLRMANESHANASHKPGIVLEMAQREVVVTADAVYEKLMDRARGKEYSLVSVHDALQHYSVAERHIDDNKAFAIPFATLNKVAHRFGVRCAFLKEAAS